MEKIYHGRYEDLGGELTFKFLIDSISPVHLTLKPITTETKNSWDSESDDDRGIINLTKVNDSFDWQPVRIAYYSSLCYGVCPAMYLEIDSAGNFYFIGGSFTEKIGIIQYCLMFLSVWYQRSIALNWIVYNNIMKQLDR
ncbi:MAG: hypothetical protein IPQ11_13490 [Bacteroidetes bacterium]|nr:hypothetical protein [Bacteroidota bacterium]